MSSIKRFRSIREDNHYIYFYIQLEFESKSFKEPISSREFKLMIVSAMQSLFGDFGVKIPIDLIKYRDSDYKAFIRTDAKELVRVRTGLTMFSNWNQRICAFRIHKVCHSLSSLAIEPINPLIIE